MPARRLISPVLSFVRWLFSAAIPGVDLFLAVLGSYWLTLMLVRPGVFDQGTLKGMQWLPDAGWFVFLVLTTALHVAGLLRLRWVSVRVSAGLLSAWFWLIVAISLSRTGLGTGSGTYTLIGLATLCAAIYISGLQRRDG